MIFNAILWVGKYLTTGSIIAVCMIYGVSKIGSPFTPQGTGYKIIIRGDQGKINDQNGRQLAHVEAKNNNVISGGGESTIVTCKGNRAVITTLDNKPLVEFENQEGVIVIISFNKEEVSDMDIKQCFGKPTINLPVN